MKTIAAIILLFQTVIFAGEDFPVLAADSGSPKVDKLVSQLVSKRPAPLPLVGRDIPEEWTVYSFVPYMTDEVSNAIQKLRQMGPSIYPYLLKHMQDDRYCYSSVMPSSIGNTGWINFSVSHAVNEVFTHGQSIGGFYKWREVSKGKGYIPPSFSDYIEAQGGINKWTDKVTTKRRVDIDIAFVDWCIAEERIRGFKDKTSEKQLIHRYLKKRKEIEDAASNLGN